MLMNFFIIYHICLTDKKEMTIESVSAYKLLLLAVSVNKKIPPGEDGIRGRSAGTRTLDPLIKSQLLYQLSYRP